jgi:hypothetical protein
MATTNPNRRVPRRPRRTQADHVNHEAAGTSQGILSHPAFDDAVARLGTWVLTAARVPVRSSTS